MNRIAAFAIAAGLLTTACVPETPGTQLTPAPQAAAAATPPLGTAPVPLQAAVDFFGATCGLTGPRFESAPAFLQNNAFAQNPATGTWYHPTLTLSFKITDECSMVLGVQEEPFVIPIVLAQAALVSGGADPDGDFTVGTEASADIVVSEGDESATSRRPDGLVATIERTRLLGGQTYYHAVMDRR
jgi:hypothetical protein